MEGGRAITEAMAVQYLMKPRRLMPALRSISPTVGSSLLANLNSCVPCGRVFAYLQTQVNGRRRDLVERAGKNFRHAGYFDRFGDKFIAAIKMFDPPNTSYLSFPNPRYTQSIHSRLHLPFPEQPLQLRSILRTHRQAAQVDARRWVSLDKALEQTHELGENRTDAST